MIFFFNANGDLLKGNPDTVYQGSSNAGKIYAVAPLNPGLIADIYFTLPNGDEAGPYLLTNGTEGKELPDGYALWFINLNSNLTQFAGDLTAQIGFYATEDMTAETADGVAQKVPVITTQAFNITIARGVARTLPAEPNNDVYEQIVNTLTILSGDLTKLTEDVKNLSATYPPASIKDIGKATVTYDTTDGVTLKNTEQWVCENGETFDIDTKREFPIRGGNGIIIDVPEDNPSFVEVKLETTPIPASEKGEANGVATLDSSGLIPTSQLPTYVDDVIDSYIVGETLFASDWLSRTPGGTPLTPERDKIYVICSEGTFINTEYRWSGTIYAALGKSTPLSNTTGQGTNIGMTQKAITDELAKKQDTLAIYTVNTANEVTIPADDLAKIKADPNAIIVEIDSTRPSVETRFYKKGIDFIGGTVFVCIYTVGVPEGCSIAYRNLNTKTGVLTARHETDATSLAEVRQEIEGKYLPKPPGNPTEDSLVKVSSIGTSSWKALSDLLEKNTTTSPYDQVYFKNTDGTNIMRNVRSVPASYVIPIYNNKGQLKTNAPEVDLDCVNKQYLETNYNANPTLDGTETELSGVTLNGTKYKVPSGGSGAGIDTLTDVNLTSSGTTVAYDIASGVTVNSNGKFTYEGGEKEATTEVNFPIVAGKGITINKIADKEQVEVKVNINRAVEGDVTGAIQIGANSKSKASDSLTLGSECKANFNYTVAMGQLCTADSSMSIAIGYNSKTGNRAIALGVYLNANKNSATVIGYFNQPLVDGDVFVAADGLDNSTRHNYFRINKETVDDTTKYTAYLVDKKLLTEDDGLSKPSGNPTEDSVVKISSTGGVSYEPLSSLGGGGSVAIEITSPATATSGTLTAEQLATLQASNDNYIIFNDEIYRLADKEHTPGILSYTHNGWNGTAMQDKSINITISTLAWTLVVGSGGESSINVQTFTINADDITATESDGSTKYTLTANSLATLKEGCLNAGKNGYLFATVEYNFDMEELQAFGKMYALISGAYTGDTVAMLSLQIVDGSGVTVKDIDLTTGEISGHWGTEIGIIKNAGGGLIIKIVSL